METLFEIRYYSNREMLGEFYKKHTRNKAVTATIIGCDIVMLFVFLWSCALNILTDMLLYFVLIAVISAMWLLMPKWTTWTILRNVKKQNDGVIPETVITFGDTIEIHEGMVHLTIEYRKIDAD